MKLKEKIDKKAALNFLKNYGVITLGCLIYSIGVSLFLDASRLASGGVTGIAIIINHVIRELSGGFTLDTGIIIIILNMPLFILGFIFIGRKFIVSTVYSTVVSSLLIWLWNEILADLIPSLNTSILISTLAGGALFGAGLGLIFRMGSSTGGTDILVKMLRKKFRYVKTGLISMTIDLIIVLISGIVFKDFELMCYTFLSIVIFTLMFDWVLYGGNSAKLIYIITTADKAQAMCDKILKELEVGATFIDGEGAYTGEQRRIIMCAIKNFLYPKLRDIVREVDPTAFTIVSSAKEIYGEGYKDHFDDEL
ncbi:MAG: YitT family protein [Clostridia bacterium]|nr:YitT family protein [Clostridia bacterium]